MQALITLMYKGITKKEGGSFINDKGVNTPYEPKYIVKFDDIDKETGETKEGKLKIDINNTTLANKLVKVQPYQYLPFLIDFNYQSNGYARPDLIDIDVTKAKIKE